MLSSQYFAIEFADKNLPVRQETLTFKKITTLSIGGSVGLSALMSVCLKAQGIIF